MSVYVGKVLKTTTSDIYDGMRIKAQIESIDKGCTIDKIPFAFPLLPKMISIRPEVGEHVLLFVNDDTEGNHDSDFRYYIGPIISQPQYMNICSGNTAITLLGGNEDGKSETRRALKAPSLSTESEGAFPRTDVKDVGLIGRKNSDIIIGEDDLCIRCGAKLLPNNVNEGIVFNGANPAFIHMKYRDASPIYVQKPNENRTTAVESTATIAADEINLISSCNMPDIEKKANILSENGLKTVIENGHPMVFGDSLIEFLEDFREAFNNHTHDWGPSTPVQDDTYTTLQTYDMSSFLSKNIRLL